MYRVKMFMEGGGGVGGNEKYYMRSVLHIVSPIIYSISYNSGPTSKMRWCAQQMVE